MAGKLPKLRLVGQAIAKSGEPEVESEFRPLGTVIAVDELDRHQRQRITEITSFVDVHATVLGAMQSARSWDLRPIVSSETENSPSIIRLLGPEVTLSVGISHRLQDYLNRLSTRNDISTKLLDWGVSDGQLWYRREFVEKTLKDTLEHSGTLGLSTALSIAKKALAELQRWHGVGLVHGHLTSSNIYLDHSGPISFLDPALGLALVQASKSLDKNTFPPGYSIESFAPESLNGETVLISSDIYCLGRTIRELFAHTAEGKSIEQAASGKGGPMVGNPLITALLAMTAADIRKRPSIDKLLEIFDTHLPSYKVANTRIPREQSEKAEVSPTKVSVPAPRQQPAIPAIPQRETIKTQAVAKRTIGESRKNSNLEDSFFDEATNNLPDIEAEDEVGHSVIRRNSEPIPKLQAREEEGAESHSPNESALKHPKKRGGILSILFFGLLIVGAAFAYQQLQTPANPSGMPSDEQLLSDWRSRIPSRVSRVFQAALIEPNSSQYARQLIEDSAIKGDISLDQVNGRLLRIAYDPRWEIELSPDDRRAAIALAAGALLKDRLPTDLVPLNQLHPGVLLAIIATANANAGRVLQDIQGSSLSALPAPIGLAFAELEHSIPNLTAAHPSVGMLARFAAGDRSADGIASFIEDHHSVALRCLSILFSGQDKELRTILETVLLHPNLKVESPAVRWGTKVDLLSQQPTSQHWAQVSEATKLRLIAGMVPGERLSTDVIIELLTHPNPALRGFAIKESLDRIAFQHPAAVTVLREVAVNPAPLNVQQTTGLVLLMINPNEDKATRAKDWLAANPPQELLQQILIAGAGAEISNKLDFFIAKSLKEKTWQPNEEMLRTLVNHPHKYVRLFAYDQAMNLKDQALAIEILTTAAKSENDPVLIKRLSTMTMLLKS